MHSAVRMPREYKSSIMVMWKIAFHKDEFARRTFCQSDPTSSFCSKCEGLQSTHFKFRGSF